MVDDGTAGGTADDPSGDGASGRDRDADGASRSGSVTLALTLDALGRLAEPEQALGDAVSWAASVTVVADDPRAVLRYTRTHDVPPSYFAGRPELGRRGTLELLADAQPTDRHVLVGDGETDRPLAEAVGWEYRPVTEAAERAGWALSPGSGGRDAAGGPAGTGERGHIRDRLRTLVAEVRRRLGR